MQPGCAERRGESNPGWDTVGQCEGFFMLLRIARNLRQKIISGISHLIFSVDHR